MKVKEFKTRKGEFLLVDLPIDIIFIKYSKKGIWVKYEDNKSYTPFLDVEYNISLINTVKQITEDQSSKIVDEWFTSDDCVIFYTDYINEGRAFETSLDSLHSLIKSLGIHLYEKPYVYVSDRITDTHTNLDSIEAMSKAFDAIDNTFYNPYIFKKK